MKVRLEVANGDLVAEKEGLPFKTLPRVIVWGDRVFVFHSSFSGGNPDMPTYREEFCFVITE